MRKLHVALDINSKKIVATRYTNFLSHDSVSAFKILEEICDIYKIKSLLADGAYDTTSLYKLCNKYNLKPIIKPRKNAKICDNYSAPICLDHFLGMFKKVCQTAFLVQLNFQSVGKEDVKLRHS